MAWKRKVSGGVLGVIGFLLSPLSWWNDAFVNLPLALGFAWLVALFYKPAFDAAVVIGYWLTNVAGFVLMHKGAAQVMERNGAGEHPVAVRYGWRQLGRDIIISLLYTAVIVFLLKLKVLQPLENYFPGR